MSDTPAIAETRLKHILEAGLLAASEPLSLSQLGALFPDEERPANGELNDALAELASDCEDRGVELQTPAPGL